MYEYRAKCRNVVDGDTVDLIVDLGFYMSAALRFRLQGINAPEKWHVGGGDATAWLEQQSLGREFAIRTEKADSFGRWVCLIKRDEDEETVNKRMVDEGHALLYTSRYAAPVIW
jgi:micrococcal nuclease